jgi:hypothetical protein
MSGGVKFLGGVDHLELDDHADAHDDYELDSHDDTDNQLVELVAVAVVGADVWLEVVLTLWGIAALVGPRVTLVIESPVGVV